MKRLVIATVLAAATLYTVPAQAECGGANCWIRYQEQTDPGYDRYQRNTLASVRYRGYGITLVDDYNGYYIDQNSVRTNTWRRGGKWYKNCGNDPAVPIESYCYAERPRYPQGYTPQAYDSGSGGHVWKDGETMP
jgi:hypothetical protein